MTDDEFEDQLFEVFWEGVGGGARTVEQKQMCRVGWTGGLIAKAAEVASWRNMAEVLMRQHLTGAGILEPRE